MLHVSLVTKIQEAKPRARFENESLKIKWQQGSNQLGVAKIVPSKTVS